MSVNRCDRCDRELMDPIAQYGWRCDKLMRSEPMPMPLMEAFPDLYLKVLEAADAFLSRHEIHSSRVDLAKFYEATAEYLLLKEMPPNPFIEESRRRALLKVYDAFGLEQDEVDPSVFTSRSVSSMFATLLEFWLENEAGTYTPPPEPVLPIPEYMKNVRNPSNASLDTLLDGFQFGLDAVGLLPGLGEIADGVNGGISLLRGDYVDATLSFASMIPFAGWASTAGKWGKKALKYGDEVLAAAKHADEAGMLLGRSGGNVKISWDSWQNYAKATVNGQEYAIVGDRLYSKHAVDRMQPSGNRFGSNIYQAGGDYGRSIAPQYVEDIINSSQAVFQPETGNYVHISGTVKVIVNSDGAVITIITYQ